MIQEAASPLTGSGQVTEATAPSSRVFRCGFVRHWVPLAYREELYQVLCLTGPLLVSRILSFLQPFVSTIFVGHLGNAELAGYALASATINVTTTATGCGLALACDTLVSQTFGGENLKRVGEILQRSILILLLFCLPCWAILINSESILLAMQQEAEVARIAQLYVLAFLPAVPVSDMLVLFFMLQGIILPQMYTAAVANILNVAINYILIFSMGLGVKGSAAANCISQISICLLLFGYIRWKKLHVRTWGGWTTASLQEWDSFMQLAIPSTLMLCFEWWIYEIGGFLAGMLGEVDLAAQHVLLELGAITYMFPLGVHAAACVDIFKTVHIFKTLLLSSLRNIIRIVSENLTFYVFSQFFDALVCVSSGILLGAGKQKIAAISNLICYYCIGLPLGISLMFAAKLRILGLTLGLLVCVIIQACFFISLIFKLNWQKVTEKAQKRAGKKTRVTCVAQKGPVGGPIIDTVIGEGEDSIEHTANGASVVSIEHLNLEQSIFMIKVCYSYLSYFYSTLRFKEGAVRPKKLLSVPQLVLRRGLTLLSAALILVVGVAVHLTCPLPEPSVQMKSNLTIYSGNYTTTPAAFSNYTLS
uniref:Multidrug and toxin extrusion protein n=1 Tax=Astyanax mexicanus TaxID=7994 RepID=A0A8B9RFP1_ASTMX